MYHVTLKKNIHPGKLTCPLNRGNLTRKGWSSNHYRSGDMVLVLRKKNELYGYGWNPLNKLKPYETLLKLVHFFSIRSTRRQLFDHLPKLHGVKMWMKLPHARPFWKPFMRYFEVREHGVLTIHFRCSPRWADWVGIPLKFSSLSTTSLLWNACHVPFKWWKLMEQNEIKGGTCLGQNQHTWFW